MINNKIIKICGMRDGDNITQAELLPIDMMGFIFYPKSPRYVYEMPECMPKQTFRVGVCVNEDKESIKMMADRFGLHQIQLHGNESPEYCWSLQKEGYQLIKAFAIKNEKDLKSVKEYEPYCKMFLFDTKCEEYGGSGTQFDWNILNKYHGDIPFMLSGGINSFSASALKEFTHPLLVGYDINSRFEIEPGLKDINKIKLFLEELSEE